MPYAPLPPADLKARFPAFAAVADQALQDALDEAGRRVDETWTDGDRRPATMLLAAHNLTLDGQGTGAESEAAAAGASGFKVMRSGSLTLERFDGASGGGSSSGASLLASTSYGRRFLELLRLNFAGPEVV